MSDRIPSEAQVFVAVYFMLWNAWYKSDLEIEKDHNISDFTFGSYDLVANTLTMYLSCRFRGYIFFGSRDGSNTKDPNLNIPIQHMSYHFEAHASANNIELSHLLGWRAHRRENYCST